MTFTMQTTIPERFRIQVSRLSQIEHKGKAQEVAFTAEVETTWFYNRYTMKEITLLNKIRVLAMRLANRLPLEMDQYGNTIERAQMNSIQDCILFCRHRGITHFDYDEVDVFQGVGECSTSQQHMLVTCNGGDLVFYRGNENSIAKVIEEFEEYSD